MENQAELIGLNSEIVIGPVRERGTQNQGILCAGTNFLMILEALAIKLM